LLMRENGSEIRAKKKIRGDKRIPEHTFPVADKINLDRNFGSYATGEANGSQNITYIRVGDQMETTWTRTSWTFADRKNSGLGLSERYDRSETAVMKAWLDHVRSKSNRQWPFIFHPAEG